MECDFVRLEIQVKITSMGIKIDSKMLLKLGNNIGVDIDSKFGTESQN